MKQCSPLAQVRPGEVCSLVSFIGFKLDVDHGLGFMTHC